MKNMIGSIIGVVVGTASLVLLLGVTPPIYPEPFQAMAFLLFGGELLEETIPAILSIPEMVPYLATWLLIGAIISVFSQRGWNTVRSVLWVAFISGLLSLVSTVLILPSFWSSPSRNLDLIILFSRMILVSMLTLPSAYPLTLLKERMRRRAEKPIPKAIESQCECGAVFRSNPILCSECGRILRDPGD
ncbi:hypothetical protein EU545_02040 [Candidatus Thorarchaeota archaeon]|nr:MAG: hypothetical protein EU545_02040 [Candidatus Thorarchaeota archaeon]